MAAAPDDTTRLAQQIADLGEGRSSRVYRMSWWTNRLLEWAMAQPDFKVQLFRLVDVFPTMTGDDDVLRHMDEYFAEVPDLPKALDLGIGAAAHLPYGRSAAARVARRNILAMADQFIIGTDAVGTLSGLHQLWRVGSAFTVDLLGEKTLTNAEAEAYCNKVVDMVDDLAAGTATWAQDDHLERDDLGALPRVNISVKPTALGPHLHPLTADQGIEEVSGRLRRILRAAARRGAFVNLDMEHYDVKDLTIEVFRRVLDEDEFAGVEAGIVVQAYLRDAFDDLSHLIAWSGHREVPITIRLVKGAYWDSETIHGHAAGWIPPVFEHKAETDANFARCARLLHDHHGDVRAAFGSHNLHSIAGAITYARRCGIPDTGYEIQMLHGMAEPIHAAIRRLGFRLRVYTPIGDLVPGMSYLVRRLLENTSNESFVRQRFAEHRDLDQLAGRGDATIPPPPEYHARQATDPQRPTSYAPEPAREWRRRAVRTTFGAAVRGAGVSPPAEVRCFIGGREIETGNVEVSVDPARPAHVVARYHAGDATTADDAVAAADQAAAPWRATTARDRAGLLFRVADEIRSRRDEIAALEVAEAGKPWAEADGDVCEAIDFCEYYGRRALELDGADLVQSPPGERNNLRYQGRGVTAVIAPWNFPLAIATGMTAGAVAAGNPVILKPAEQTPAVAGALMDAFRRAGVPAGVVNFVPGPGETVGAALVEHPDVAAIAFTGSMAVGLGIIRAAAESRIGQRRVKKVVAEMGGKNAMIIDADADPDQAVPAIVGSAFGFAGQKCSAASRLILLDPIHDRVLDRLVDAVRGLLIGPPSAPWTQVGPLIDNEARAKIDRYTVLAHEVGRVVAHRTDLPDEGYYAGPVVVTDVDPDDPVACDEIFGPVLAVFRVADMDEAIDLANRTPFGLTAGLFSRSPRTVKRARHELAAGNVYINRPITGAVVGRQPFGGIGLSGVGSKAGGPDYVRELSDTVAISENTMRQGFAPET